MATVAAGYFRDLYMSHRVDADEIINHVQRCITAVDNDALVADFTKEEFRIGLFDMDPGKARGWMAITLAFIKKLVWFVAPCREILNKS